MGLFRVILAIWPEFRFWPQISGPLVALHIASSKHTLALKVGTDKVFDATNPKMKSELQKNEDFNEILAKNEISRGAQMRAQ